MQRVFGQWFLPKGTRPDSICYAEGQFDVGYFNLYPPSLNITRDNQSYFSQFINLFSKNTIYNYNKKLKFSFIIPCRRKLSVYKFIELYTSIIFL